MNRYRFIRLLFSKVPIARTDEKRSTLHRFVSRWQNIGAYVTSVYKKKDVANAGQVVSDLKFSIGAKVSHIPLIDSYSFFEIWDF